MGSRPVEVAGVVPHGEGTGEPALVEAGAVRIDTGDEIPGGAQPIAQVGVGAEDTSQVVDHHRPNRLVGVRAGEEEDLLLAGAV
jgi:molybdopterin biosynthesis enzyme